MFIYIDESGTFVPSATPNSWNVVAALVVPEATRKHISDLLRRLKNSCGRACTDEVKLRDVPEACIRSFINDLSQLNATLYASCIDAGAHDVEVASAHKTTQVEKIRENIPKMIYPDGRAMIEDLANRVERLSNQLYTQMVVQIDLLDHRPFGARAATWSAPAKVPPTSCP